MGCDSVSETILAYYFYLFFMIVILRKTYISTYVVESLELRNLDKSGSLDINTHPRRGVRNKESHIYNVQTSLRISIVVCLSILIRAGPGRPDRLRG